MRSLDSRNTCLCLLVLTAEPHFDVLLTKNGLIHSAMYLIRIIYYNNMGKHWEEVKMNATHRIHCNVYLKAICARGKRCKM